MAKAFCQEPSRKKLETAQTAYGAIADGPKLTTALHIPPIKSKGRFTFHFRPPRRGRKGAEKGIHPPQFQYPMSARAFRRRLHPLNTRARSFP
jgi:hypothetical protein